MFRATASRGLGAAVVLCSTFRKVSLQQQTDANQCDFFIIGGGLTASTAVEALVKDPSSSTVAVCIGTEPGETPDITGMHQGVQVIPSSVVSIDTNGHQATLSDGSTMQYGRCMIACEGDMKVAREAINQCLDPTARSRVFTDINKVLQNKKASHVTVIGGGWRGCDAAFHLAKAGKKVSLVYNEIRLLYRYTPKHLSDLMMKQLDQLGVVTYNFAQVRYVMGHKGYVDLHLQKKHDHYSVTNVQSQAVLLAPTNCRAQADLALCTSSHLEEDLNHGGIVVNSELQAATDLWVAGDSACFYSDTLGRCRANGEDHCMQSAGVAANNMLGGTVMRYDHIPERKFQCIQGGGSARLFGRLQSALETVSYSWKNGGPESMLVCYIDNTKLVGVLLWNIDTEGDMARRWLCEPANKTRDELFARMEGMCAEINEQLPQGHFKLTRKWTPASDKRSMVVEIDDETADFASETTSESSTHRYMQGELGGADKFNNVMIHNIRTTSESRENPANKPYNTHLITRDPIELAKQKRDQEKYRKRDTGYF